MATPPPKTMALAALDIGAYAFMRLYERSGKLQTPGLVLADNARSERLLAAVRERQRLTVREGINQELIAVGKGALDRARTGTPITRIDELLLALDRDDESATDDIVSKGFAVDRVTNDEATASLTVRVELVEEQLAMTRLTATGGAPRDDDDLRTRAAGVLLWADITGTGDPGPVIIHDAPRALAALKEHSIPIKRAFRADLIRAGRE